jgi:toxin ParE1/3/4
VLPIKWKTSAREDLATIVDYIEQYNQKAAERIREQIEQATLALPYNPYQYRRSERISGARELVAHPNYLVFYSVSDVAIDILAVVHVKRDYP